MKAVDTRSKKAFLDQIKTAVKDQFSKAETDDVTKFIDQLFVSVFINEFEGRRVSDLLGLIISAWKFFNTFQSKNAKVEVFNPSFEEDAWHSSHTVIMVLQRNTPFIVDSVRMVLAANHIKTHSIQYSSIQGQRDEHGTIQKITQSKQSKAVAGEAIIFIEVDKHSDHAARQNLKASIEYALKDVSASVNDYSAMKEVAVKVSNDLSSKNTGTANEEEIDEAKKFICWLSDNHFTFLSYLKYKVTSKSVEPVKGSELGLIKLHPERVQSIKYSDIHPKIKAHILKDCLFSFSKDGERSRVHRSSYPDVIRVKEFDSKGKVAFEHCFFGLYTASAYAENLNDTPILRLKKQYVIDQSGLNVHDYRGKELQQLLTAYPRENLFQLDKDELFNELMSTLLVQERLKSSLFMRTDPYGGFVSCQVYVPRETYNTSIRKKIQNLLMEELNGQDMDYNTFISDSDLARTIISIKIDPAENLAFNAGNLEEKIASIASLWEDELEGSLMETYGEEKSSSYINKFRNAFSSSYQEDFSPRRAAIDVEHINNVGQGQQLGMSFYRALYEDDKVVHFKLFHLDQPVPLSDVMPIFEHMGFRVIGEKPYETLDKDAVTVWVHDFMLTTANNQGIDIQKIKGAFESLFRKVWQGEAENDCFNRLVTAAYLNWREISMLRSYARYMRQIRVGNSQDFISDTIVKNVQLTKILVEFFDIRFDPNNSQTKATETADALMAEFYAELDKVLNLSEDKILRVYLDLMKATMRTNYFQSNEDGSDKNFISFKFMPRLIPNVPLPVPLYEIFVYSPRIEGVHLRGGKVARGGLRWSDRYEDYRTEVLGLVKAQQVKNAVIVPVGAKGGFVAKKLPQNDRDAFTKEGIACYQIFITGLLNVTDNLIDGKVVKPVDVICHDEDDYYLVVAADKGTATFSDIANEISLDKGHWLGDAFASGGSQGYDHKKMGITAKGAWVSVQRHFREMGRNIQTTPFTAIGIGDMAGDVFGNGMLLSRFTQLVCAFNHMHIFIDPSPDHEKSFAERKRLFDLPRSSWSDYNVKLISKGGGIFSRSEKSIPISKEIQQLLSIKDKKLPPNQLITAILKAEADLLWIGGIGTYVMASDESHSDVGDKANDALRITGSELNVKVVGEGGNLGMTQLSRIEYDKKGGRLNTDFIDNAAGVDCSDHEVNIKILFNEILQAGDLTEKQRNKLLIDMTDDVSDLVLKNNYRQTQAISIAHRDALSRTEEYRRLINSMEACGKLNRELEFLPSDEDITERKSLGKRLTRPELSVLISYVKGDLKEELIDSELPDNPYLVSEINDVFPKQIIKKYKTQLHGHRLRREIISTHVANDMVNHMGISFVERLKQSTGATPASISMAYIIARDVFNLSHWWESIEALDNKVSSELQMSMMAELMSLMRRACRWLIRNRRSELNVTDNMDKFKKGIAQISKSLPSYLIGSSKETWVQKYETLKDQGVPDDIAEIVAGSSHLYAALGIIEAQDEGDGSLSVVANAYYILGNRLELIWFGQQINKLTPLTHWQALAREAFREDLDWQQRALTVGLLKLKGASQDIEKRINVWMEQHEELVARWQHTLTEFKATEDAEFSMYSVALRELLDLAQSTVHAVRD